MANSDNKCSDLEIKDYYSDKNVEDSLKMIYEKQINLQKRLGFDFEDWSLKKIADFWMVNKHAMSDELNEMFDALGGINEGIGSSAWKYWKKNHGKSDMMKISDLSEEDRLELYYEWIDGLHFYMNFAISIGMTHKDILNLYMAKNEENHDRQDRGY
jgi:dimeric dUTPase (all-alpha-NTP-PPase superfamily)